MVFHTDPHIKNAKTLIQSDSPDHLYYACLELRYAIEKITYQKLKLRLEKITLDEISGWQPKRALDCLMELVDEHLDQDSILNIAEEDGPGKTPDADKFITIGKNKGVNPKELGKHWQKLGSYLHITLPKSKTDQPKKKDSKNLKNYLESVISYIEDLTSTSFDSHFSMNVTLQCPKCEKATVRNEKLLKDGQIVQCQSPECSASYITHRNEDGSISFETYLLTIKCPNCDEEASYDANFFVKMKYREACIATCDKCGKKQKIWWRLYAGLIEETETAASK